MGRKHVFVSASVVFVALALATGSATAVDEPEVPDIEIIAVGYGGTGCPQGSATALISDDKRSFSILFDQYVAQTWGFQWSVRRSCNIAVSLRIPPGYSVALLKIDYRGYANIPIRGRGWFRSEYFFAGRRGPIYRYDLPDGEESNYLFTDHVGGSVWSECGDDVIARANTSILAEKSSPSSPYEATVTVDSADLEAGIIYYIDWSAC